MPRPEAHPAPSRLLLLVGLAPQLLQTSALSLLPRALRLPSSGDPGQSWPEGPVLFRQWEQRPCPGAWAAEAQVKLGQWPSDLDEGRGGQLVVDRAEPLDQRDVMPEMLRSGHLTNGSPPQLAAGLPGLGNKNTGWPVKSEFQISGPGAHCWHLLWTESCLFLGSSPNPQHLRMWLYLEMGSLVRELS